MIVLPGKCDRCRQYGETSAVYHEGDQFLLCSECEPKVEEFWVRHKLDERYANRGGLIYGAPWWRFNKPTGEDRQWEIDTFGRVMTDEVR